MNKIELIKTEIQKAFDKIKNSEKESDSGAFYILQELLSIVDSIQSQNLWHDSSEEPEQNSNILMIRTETPDSDYPPIAGTFHGSKIRTDNKEYWGYYNGFCYNEIEKPIKWCYVSDLM